MRPSDTAGSGLDRVVQITMLITDPADHDACNADYVKHFPIDNIRTRRVWRTAVHNGRAVGVGRTNQGIRTARSPTISQMIFAAEVRCEKVRSARLSGGAKITLGALMETR